MRSNVHKPGARHPWQHIVTPFASRRSVDRMDVATQTPRAECALEEFQDRKDQNRARNTDTRSFGYENNDESIQLCEDEEGQAGPPQVVQQDRLSSDTHEFEIGDSESLVGFWMRW